jgi:hypothetical protein
MCVIDCACLVLLFLHALVELEERSTLQSKFMPYIGPPLPPMSMQLSECA